MIGIQGETALEEVTKSPADAALSTTSTNSVQNKVVTKEINEINNDLSDKADASVLINDVTSQFSFGNVFTSMSRKAVIINNKVLVLHLDGYKSTSLPIGENEHFCTVSASLLARIETGSHYGIAWNSGEKPHIININKDSTGLAYTERTSTFQYIAADLIFILAN